MAHAPWRSLDERVAQLEATITWLRQSNDQLRATNNELREHLENAHEAEAILRRVQQASSPLEPMRMTPPPPRNGHRRPRSRDVTYLRVVKVVAVACLAAGVLGGAIIPASSLVTGPSPASAGTTFAGMEQDHVDAAEAGLCDGQLPEVGEWPGSDALVGAGRSPFGVVAFGGDAARVIAGGWCGG